MHRLAKQTAIDESPSVARDGPPGAIVTVRSSSELHRRGLMRLHCLNLTLAIADRFRGGFLQLDLSVKTAMPRMFAP